MKNKLKEKNRQYHIDYNKEYYHTHKSELQKYYRQYYKVNRDKLLESSKFSYNRVRKNDVRNKIIEIMGRYAIKNILTLESKKFLFSKQVPDKKIIVFEKDISTYNAMKLSKPKNVSLFFGDVSEYAELNAQADFIYLDFCSMFVTAKEKIYALKKEISKVKLFAVTLCSRGERDGPGDYQCYLIGKIQEITGINWKVLYGEGYKDNGHTSMVTLMFENPNQTS